MSACRTCPNCYRVENTRYNFGDNKEAEQEFHKEKWCDCGYSSPEEMMQDQDMGFDDPKWIRIAKHFIPQYLRTIRRGEIESNEEGIRYFLKLLKSSAKNTYSSLELVEIKEVEKWDIVANGKSEHKPKSDIFVRKET